MENGQRKPTTSESLYSILTYLNEAINNLSQNQDSETKIVCNFLYSLKNFLENLKNERICKGKLAVSEPNLGFELIKHITVMSLNQSSEQQKIICFIQLLQAHLQFVIEYNTAYSYPEISRYQAELQLLIDSLTQTHPHAAL